MDKSDQYRYCANCEYCEVINRETMDGMDIVCRLAGVPQLIVQHASNCVGFEPRRIPMSMTLEEAIEQIERTCKENHNGLVYTLKRGDTKYAERCKKAMDESKQLVKWLKELQERRKKEEN